MRRRSAFRRRTRSFLRSAAGRTGALSRSRSASISRCAASCVRAGGRSPVSASTCRARTTTRSPTATACSTVNLPKGTLGGATASADVIAGQLFTRSRIDRRAAAQRPAGRIAGGAGVAAAAGSGDRRKLRRLPRRCRSMRCWRRFSTSKARHVDLVLALESSQGIPDPADIDALEAPRALARDQRLREILDEVRPPISRTVDHGRAVMRCCSRGLKISAPLALGYCACSISIDHRG